MSRLHSARTSTVKAATARAVVVLALASAAGGLLTACGGDDSTASSNPAPIRSSAAQASGSKDASAKPSASKSAEESAPVTSPGEAATAPPEQPQPVPSGFPGPTAAPADPRSKGLTDALDKAGIKSSGNSENAIAIANYICAAKQEGSSQEEIDTNVTAMAGVEINLSGNKLKPEDAAKIYEDAAEQTYCKQ